MKNILHKIKLIYRAVLLLWKHGDLINLEFKYQKTQLELRQERCAIKNHKKGSSGRGGDPALHQHTFIDGSVKIWCQLCGWTIWWRKGLPVDPEWNRASALLELSTNRPSSSEIPVAGYVEKPQPIHGQDEYFGAQIRLKEDDSPIKGKEKSKWDLQEGIEFQI